jgi:hypothetical protein
MYPSRTDKSISMSMKTGRLMAVLVRFIISIFP